MRLLASSENPEIHDIIVNDGVMTTSDYNADDGCNIVYTEEASPAACATNPDGRSNSAEFNGYNVYLRYMGEKLYPHDINPFAPAPYQFSVTPTDDSYKSVTYEQAIVDMQCWDTSWLSFDQVRMWCDAYTGPSGTDPPGSWVPLSLRNAADYQALTTTNHGKCIDFETGVPTTNADYFGQRTFFGITDDQDGWGGSVGNNCAVRNTVYTDIWGNPTDYPFSQDGANEWTLYNGEEGGIDDGQASAWFEAFKGKEYRQHMDCVGTPGDLNPTMNDRNCANHIMMHACMPKWDGVDGPNGDPTECGALREPWTAEKVKDFIKRTGDDGGDDVQCFQPCPAGDINECDDGATFAETFTKCAEYTGPNSDEEPGTWVPISIENYGQFSDIDTKIIQGGKNGCTAGETMTWMGLNDHMNSCHYGAGKFHDIWGNQVAFENWDPDTENKASTSPNALSENACVKCGGQADNFGCRAVRCDMKHNYMCVRKHQKVAGPTNVPGRTCLPIIPRAVDVCPSNLCTSWGDPHVIMFDGDVTDVFGVNQYIYSMPTPYASDTLGVHNFQVKTQTKRLGTVSINKELIFTFRTVFIGFSDWFLKI